MPLSLYHQPSFNRCLKRLDSEQLKIVGLILEALEAYYSSGSDLTKASIMAPRFFYKQLRKPYYEAGVERSLRVVIRREGEKCLLVLAGKHDQIRKFLSEL